MNDRDLLKKLRKRRKLLDLDQHYMGSKLNMTQSGYSWVENGKVKLTPALLQKIKEIEGFEHFDTDPPEEVVKIGVREFILQKWPWSKRSLFITLMPIGLLYFEKVLSVAEDISRGFNPTAGPHTYVTLIVALILGSPYAIFVCWLFWPKTWSKKKNYWQNGAKLNYE